MRARFVYFFSIWKPFAYWRHVTYFAEYCVSFLCSQEAPSDPPQATRPENQILMRGVRCSRSLVPGISPQWPRLDIRPVHVRFMMDKVALAEIFIWVLRLFQSSLPPYCTLIFFYMLLLQGRQTSKTWEPSERNALSEIGKHWIENYFHLQQILMLISQFKLKFNPQNGGHQIMFPNHKLSIASRSWGLNVKSLFLLMQTFSCTDICETWLTKVN